MIVQVYTSPSELTRFFFFFLIGLLLFEAEAVSVDTFMTLDADGTYGIFVTEPSMKDPGSFGKVTVVGVRKKKSLIPFS